MKKLTGIAALLHRTLSVIAPGWARNRMLARAQMEYIARAFEGSTPLRTTALSSHRRLGPKDNSRNILSETRAQARELYRRNPYARGIINSIVANLIGCGIQPQARVILPRKAEPDEAFNDIAEEEWKRWQDAADPTGKQSFYEQQSELQREFNVVGEALLLLGSPPEGDTRRVPLATEVIPSERLSDREDLNSKNGTKIVQGIQYNTAGRIEGYWIYPNHPYETLSMGGTYGPGSDKFVPADRVIHYYDRLEPGQIRGLTRFLTVSGAFEGFLQWLDWLLVKERVASAFAIAILRNAGYGINSPILAPSADVTTDEEDDEDYLEGGMIAHLKPGEDIRGIQSGVQAASVDLLSQVFLRVIARGLDVSYELVSRDLSKVTYLSARQGENQDRRHWEPQQELLNRRVNYPLWREWVTAAYTKQLLPFRGKAADLERYKAVDFIRPGWPWIDPVKEITADVEALKAGLISPQDLIVKRGGDPYKVLRDLSTFKAWAENLGLELSIFQTVKAPPVAAAPGSEETTPEKDDEVKPEEPTEEADDGEEAAA